MKDVNRIKVLIDENVYELSSPESPEYIHKVAGYIDKKIKSIYSVKSEGSMNPRLKTLFISLNIADDLFKERAEVERLLKKVDELELNLKNSEDHILKQDEELIILTDKLKDFESEADKARNELAEYVEAFALEEELNKDSKVARLKR
ncbi:MAG: cell division protein ZapA [Clostridiales bacterium]|jgi:cell division protein ZapA|nr:cell division protein ZapA [Clostridiales bacterium]